jgi:hypothetical protein
LHDGRSHFPLIPNSTSGIGDGKGIVGNRIRSGDDDGKVQGLGYLGNVADPRGIPRPGGIPSYGEEPDGTENCQNSYDNNQFDERKTKDFPKLGSGLEATGGSCGIFRKIHSAYGYGLKVFFLKARIVHSILANVKSNGHGKKATAIFPFSYRLFRIFLDTDVNENSGTSIWAPILLKCMGTTLLEIPELSTQTSQKYRYAGMDKRMSTKNNRANERCKKPRSRSMMNSSRFTSMVQRQNFLSKRSFLYMSRSTFPASGFSMKPKVARTE